MSAHRECRWTRYALALAIFASVLGIGSARADNTDERSSAASAEIARQPGRPNSSRAHEPGALIDLQRRLDSISAVGTSECLATYAAHKAQAWLNFGKYAAAEQLPPAAQAAVLKNAGRIVEGLEQHEGSALDTPELPGARHVRSDLWAGIAAVKRDARLCAAPKMTAYCEVQLAWVDYEAAAGGWRHVDPYIRIAEDYCSTAIATQPSTALPPAAARNSSAVMPEPTLLSIPTAPVPTPPPTTDRIDLSMSVVFPHNRATRADIRRPGRAALRRLSKRFKSLPKDTTIIIVGHADLTGRPDYNLRLSEQRARSVARELRMLGVHVARIRLAAVGSSDPVVQCALDDEVAERRRYLACLEPNRRVVIQLIANVP
jgi:outer membrane protein OmpA-like peptidoglycan-associated protein